MAGVAVAAEWQLLYNRYYRKPELYQMQWKNVDLTRNKIACAPFGGPIAAIRDDTKIVQLYAESAQRKLRIYTSSGILISESIWKNPGGRLIGMSWTDDLTLICITQDGTIYSYNIHAELLSTSSLGKECFANSVVDCVFWGNGVVCINEAFEIFAVPDFKTPTTVVKLADCGLEELPHCMAVIEPQYRNSGDVEVLLGVGDHVLSVEEDEVQELGVGVGPLQKMVVSRKGEFVASITHDGRLLVMSSDFSNVIIEYACEADENLRSIRSSLPEAVEACVDAAGYEFDISQQRTLLRAASYGQAFCSHFQHDRIQETSKMLRVLNAVRHAEIGIPLSIQQYKLLTPTILINRLINAHKHLLALRISEYLGLNQEVVVMHWACTKITASLPISDANLLQILLDKLKICKGISYAAVAAHADKSGRRKLAAMLVEDEPHSSKQIPLLLSIGEEDNALMKATDSGDTDLVYLVLFHMWQKKLPLEFFGTIQARPLARDLFVIYARFYKHEFLKDFFLSTGQLQDVAFLLWKESWELAKNPMASKGSPLHGPRIKLIEKAQNLFAETKEHTFESKAAEEHAKLLRIQHDLEVTTKQAIFVDSSISDTIRTCIVLGNHRAAMKVKTEFKVSEKRWYWLKVFALATIRDWEALEKFSKEKRPPIGYRPFVEACTDAGEKAEALKYIPKLADPREKAEAYARIGMAKEAADAASQTKDSELLGRFKLPFSQNASAASIFDTLRDRLSFQGNS
ncbi:vacuolar protein sorting-associated protein 16 [Dorcoceras hygrometricum]|uniref:Vacuolar protein sorting-associated protein 16 n=1 Tax=Dorcoceras hygrometricum TaxID=472368 RepID=A0A2Z7A4W5_9LAMI|nr:vacuolar protein sorting-associated protein 16 [Dorcoceras hygrometricum]